MMAIIKEWEKMEDYIRGLEEERIKIQVFQRELPLCLQLVTKAIESCKQKQQQTSCNSSDQTSTEADFIPIPVPVIIKRASSKSNSNSNNSDSDQQPDVKIPKIDNNKPDWLRSTQLWNQTPPSSKQILQDDSTNKVNNVVGVKSGGAFHPFKKQKNNAAAHISQPKGNINKEDRKSRRCWSAQLHKRFLQALHELGGSHVATPKQIRDLMKVDGLTNDEVKSHLQKYRLHTRRPNPSSQNITTATTQAPQFVVVTGGLWMPPEYTAGEAAIYAPIASLPPPPPFQETLASPTQIQHSSNNTTTSDSNVKGSHSPLTSSSTHTSTASLAY